VSGGYWMIGMCAAFGFGFMLPKLYIRRRAAARRQSVGNELPLLVDMLRLLQGVGLSLDQSLQVVTNDFRGMLPVLSSEVGIAQRQFAAGRTREQSLQRLSSGFDNEDLRAVVRLMIQVDKHGGAVQEPLKQFGLRLQENRRARMKDRIDGEDDRRDGADAVARAADRDGRARDARGNARAVAAPLMDGRKGR